MISKILIWMMILIAIIVSIFILWIIVLYNDDEENDDSEYPIICGNTGEPCIKDTMYGRWDHCYDCPFYDYEE